MTEAQVVAAGTAHNVSLHADQWGCLESIAKRLHCLQMVTVTQQLGGWEGVKEHTSPPVSPKVNAHKHTHTKREEYKSRDRQPSVLSLFLLGPSSLQCTVHSSWATLLLRQANHCRAAVRGGPVGLSSGDPVDKDWWRKMCRNLESER